MERCRRPRERPRRRQPLQDAQRGGARRDHATVGKDEPKRRVALFLGDVLEHRISGGVSEPEEREAPAAIERSDDVRGEPAELAIRVVEENCAGHLLDGTARRG